MADEEKVWADGEEGGTPIIAGELNRLERRVTDALAVTWAEVAGKPSTFPPVVGTTATTAKAGNYTPAWGDVTGKPAVIAAGADAAAARTVIGAGTGNSNLALGATGTTAAAGDHTHTAAAIGAAATSHTHTSAQVNVTADATNGIAAGTLQAALSALAARVVTLEGAGA